MYGFDRCNEDKNLTKQDLCKNEKPEFSNSESYPVWGQYNGTWLMFRNQHCADCNNATNTEKTDPIVTDCDFDTFDKNVPNSVKELEQNLRMSKCNAAYFVPRIGNTACPEPGDISDCNVTGLWDIWDKEIDNACHTIDSKFFVFKNVFCYICNTGARDLKMPVIHSCINHVNKFVEAECLNGHLNIRTLPYWNEYCRECNKIPGLDYWLNDFPVNYYNTSSEYPYEGTVYLVVDMCNLRYSEAYKYLLLSTVLHDDYICFSLKKEYPELEASFQLEYSALELSSKHSDMRSLHNEYVRFGGTSTWCNSPGGTECSCDISCFILHNCCPEMTQNDPVECREMDGRNVTVITKCPPGFQDKVLRYYCERNYSDMITMLDVNPSYDLNEVSPEFKNIFCQICNLPSKIESTLRYKTRRVLHLKCKKYVDFENFLPFQYNFAYLQNTCQIEYKSSSHVEMPTCYDRAKDREVSVCGQTHDSKLSTLAYMCEKGGPYIYSQCKKKFPNIFCEMCSLKHGCNTTGRSCDNKFDLHDVQSCEAPRDVLSKK